MASIYVGTYSKYNNGSLAGAWVELDNFTDKEAFIDYCQKLHADEKDAEFMYQDFEGFPERFYSESGISDDLFDFLAMDEDDQLMLEAYIDATGDASATLDDASDAFQGQYDNDEDFVYQLLSDCGDLPDTPHYIVIDWQATARNIMFDYFEANGYYFRNQ
jgi:antirestriction protein